MARLTIDGQTVEVQDGSTILDAACKLNIKIPLFFALNAKIRHIYLL